MRHLAAVSGDSEDRDLTPTEQTLTRVRLAVFSALEFGATRQDIDREIAEAYTIYLRMQRGGSR
jgi:hypothetical protein